MWSNTAFAISLASGKAKAKDKAQSPKP